FSAASALGLRGAQYTQSGFLPLPGVAKQGAPGRDRAAAAVVDYLRERPELETVVLAGFWAHRATGRSYRHQGDVWMDAGYDGSGVRYNASALSGGLGRLISAFPDRRFVILDGVAADAALDPRTYARRAIAARAPETAEAGAPAAKAATLRATYEPVLRRVAVSYPNVSYAPVFRELCDAELCPLFDDAEPIYRNGDHLSVHGALKLAPALTVTLRDTVIASRD
ncbi:MAG: SGNH hydrolase domain-containing protein, partial [Pseudomonadota bacterium]